MFASTELMYVTIKNEGSTPCLIYFCFTFYSQQTRLIKGLVTEQSQKGKYITNAVIKTKDEQGSRVSDLEGRFSIEVNAAFDTLITYLTSFKSDRV